MKRTLLFMICATLLCASTLIMAACGGGNHSATEAPTTEATVEMLQRKLETAENMLKSTIEDAEKLLEKVPEDYFIDPTAISNLSKLKTMLESAKASLDKLPVDTAQLSREELITVSSDVEATGMLLYDAACMTLGDYDRRTAELQEAKLWTTVTVDCTNSDGYQLTATLTYSQLYTSNNRAELEKLWKKIGNGNQLPDENTWGFTKYADDLWKADFNSWSSEPIGLELSAKVNALYYMVGTVCIENHTPGWSFSSSLPGSPVASLRTKDSFYNGNQYMVGRVYFSNESISYDCNLPFRPKMTSDKAVLPFVVSLIEYYSPNYPDGMRRPKYEEEGFMYFGLENSKRVNLELSFYDEP